MPTDATPSSPAPELLFGSFLTPAAARPDRLLNITGEFTASGRGLLQGPSEVRAEQLAEISLAHRVSGFVLGTDAPATPQRFGEEVAPAVRALVGAEHDRTERGPTGRSADAPAAEEQPPAPTPAPAVRLSDRRFWDETTWPAAPPPPGDRTYTQDGRAVGQHRAVDELTDALLSHLSYEEQQLVEPLARHGFFAGQL